MSGRLYDYCIVGAGPSGLTAALELLKGGRSVLLIERDSRAGGLAKSYNYDGQIFDTGPKRFHTDDKVVLDFIEDITQGDIARIGRSTKVHFLGQYYEWPLETKDVFKMPPTVSVRCFLDLIKERKITDPASFHQYIRSKYGETLYKTFFEPYTQKFLRWDVEDIHCDWASTGINRTVIDSRIKSNTLTDLLKTILLPAKLDTEFLYPKHGGFGGFYEQLLSRCRVFDNFKLVLSDSFANLELSGGNFNVLTKNLLSFKFRELIWTGNLNSLGNLIDSDRQVHYLNTIFYNLICRQEGIGRRKAQWIYVSRGDSLISRITCMKEFLPSTCLDGYYNIMCEITDSQSKPLYFQNPEKFVAPMLDELLSMKFLKNTKCVEDIKINAVEDTYPIYHRRYITDFGQAAAKIKKFSKNIHLLGRSGAFWYNNSDHSIRFAIELTKKLLGRPSPEFDYRHYFGGHQSRSASAQGVSQH